MTLILNPDPHCTIARIDETLQKRARAHEAIARAFRKAAKALPLSVKLLGVADVNAADRARVNFNLRARIRELESENDKLDEQNTSLIAQVLGDDPIAVTMVEAAE